MLKLLMTKHRAPWTDKFPPLHIPFLMNFRVKMPLSIAPVARHMASSLAATSWANELGTQISSFAIRPPLPKLLNHLRPRYETAFRYVFVSSFLPRLYICFFSSQSLLPLSPPHPHTPTNELHQSQTTPSNRPSFSSPASTSSNA